MARAGKDCFASIIDGRELPEEGRSEMEVFNPFTHETIGKISCATPEDVQSAVIGAHRVYSKTMKKMPAHIRSEILQKTAEQLRIEAEQFMRLLCEESGKPTKESRVEVERAIQVLRFAAESAKSIYKELIPLGNAAGGEHQLGMSKRISLGTVAIITPFNLPVNLVVHKIAPAIAAGNTVVLKPSVKTALSSVFLYRLLEKAGLPKGAFNIILGVGEELTEALVAHPKVKCVMFAGKNKAGWKVKEMAKRKKVKLEPESKAINIIFEDADLDTAVNAIVIGGFRYAGQSFMSAQRVYVQDAVYLQLLNKLSVKLKALKIGDPLDELTDMGPMITQESAEKAMSWATEAVDQGAALLVGGKSQKALMEPTVISNVTAGMKIFSEQMLAPLISVMPFDTEAEVLSSVADLNLDRYAAIFTADIKRAQRVADAFGREAAWVNEVAVRRYEQIPYGGVNNSGIAKEGIYHAIEEMTDLKIIGIRLNRQ